MNELNDRAESFLRSSEGKKLMGKKEELSSLTSSEDGKTVKEMLEKTDIGASVSRGDTEAVRRTIESVMKTEAGARLFEKLRELMR